MRRTISKLRWVPSCLVGSMLLAVALLGGCSEKDPAPKPNSTSGAAKPPESPSHQTQLVSAATVEKSDNPAVDVLRQMAKVYLDLKSYSDQGQASMRYKLDDQLVSHDFPFEVTFQRPNLLRLKAYEGEVVCDGKVVYSQYEDVPGYVVEADAPPQLSPADVYKDDYIRYMLLERPVGGALQLTLLLSGQFVEQLIASANGPLELLPAAEIDGAACNRVRIAMPEGKMIMWVDQKTFALRRVEYPTDALRKHLEQEGQVSELAVVADFHRAQINGSIDPATFQFAVPPGAKLVKRFVGPAPDARLGKKAGSFEFKALDGTAVTPESLAGKVVVLDFWATWCQPCLQSMPELAKVQELFKDNDKVRFLAVNIEDETVTPETLTNTLKELAPNLTIVRDPDQHAFKSFGIDAIPTTYLLGADGTIQNAQRGINPNVDFVEDLSGKLNALLAGKSLHQQQLDEFEKSMMEPPAATPISPSAPGSEAQAAEAAAPEAHKLTKLWTAEDVRDPGNILIVPGEGGQPTVLAMEGWQAVVEVDAAGKVSSRYPLDVPNQGVIAYLRSAVDGEGRRYYLGSAIGQSQVHYYDQKFQHLLSYPQSPDHAGIFDCLPADLDGDGKLELLVSYLDVVGVQAVSPSGERIWSNRSIRDVFRMVLTEPLGNKSREILAAHSQGSIARLTAQGERGDEIKVPDQFFRGIASAPIAPGGRLSYAGLGLSPEGNDLFLGFSLAGQQRFSYGLPRGEQHPSLEQITWGQLVGDAPHWIVAGPDGSVHFVADDGQALDRFTYGEVINGVATTTIEGKPALLISSKNGLEAWRVEKK